MAKNRDSIPEVLNMWYPDMDFTDAKVYYNDFNCMFYIHARMRKKRRENDKAGNEKSKKKTKSVYRSDVSMCLDDGGHFGDRGGK